MASVRNCGTFDPWFVFPIMHFDRDDDRLRDMVTRLRRDLDLVLLHAAIIPVAR